MAMGCLAPPRHPRVSFQLFRRTVARSFSAAVVLYLHGARATTPCDGPYITRRLLPHQPLVLFSFSDKQTLKFLCGGHFYISNALARSFLVTGHYSAFHRAPWPPPKQSTMAAADYLSDIIDTRGNIGIIDIRDITDVFHPAPSRRVIKGPVQPATPPTSLTPSEPLASFIPCHSASPTTSKPSTIHKKEEKGKHRHPRHHRCLSRRAFRHRRRPRRLRSPRLDQPRALLGATVPASPPGTFALPLSALTVLLQLRARPPPSHPTPFTLPQNMY